MVQFETPKWTADGTIRIIAQLLNYGNQVGADHSLNLSDIRTEPWNATATPNFPGAGEYIVYVAWGEGGSRRSPIVYHVNHAQGQNTFEIDQTAVANVWIQLGTGSFYFDQGYGGSVVMTNEATDLSGSMYAGAVKFEYVSGDATNWEVR